VRFTLPVLLAGLLAGLLAAPEPRAQPAPQVRFERATEVEPHLPQSSVYAVVEDRRGFLWFATREGLGRWDGYTMRTWKTAPFDAASLPGNVVRGLVEDGDGNLWAKTEATDWAPTGIARLVGPAHEEVRRYGFAGAALFLGPDRAAWLAAPDSLYRFDAARDRFVGVRPAATSAAPQAGLARRDGSVWVGTADGRLTAYPLGSGAVRPYHLPADWPGYSGPTPVAFSHLFEDDAGTLWISGAALGRLRSDGTVERLRLSERLDSLGFNRILQGDDGWLWVGTLDGVYRFRPEGVGVRAERYTLRRPGDVPTQDWVTALHRDRAGTLWAGTVWGLHRQAPYDEPFRLIAHDPDDPNGLGSGIVLALHEDAAGMLWVGTLGGGLHRLDLATDRATSHRHRPDDPGTLSHDWVWSLAGDDEGLWIGTGAGLDRLRFDRPDRIERRALALPPGPPGPSGNRLHLAADGTLWFGHTGRLFRRAPDGALASTPLPPGAAVEAVLAVPGGAWVASTVGLQFYDAAADAFRSYRHDPADPTSLSHDAVIALHRDRRGRLWAGTYSGLNRYDPATDGFVHLTSADGLPSDVVYALLEDDAGRLWLSTNRGLARYDERAPAGRRVHAFTVEDGVGNVEFNRNAAFRARDGTMYFGGDRGVTVFHPDAIRDNPYRPPVVLTALHRATRDGTAVEHYVGEGPVILAPDATTFAFEFAALSFTSPHRNRYAVRMEGWDDWVDLGTQRRATYTNLPPGRYVFRVRAANEDGVWNEEGTAVPVVVQPRYFQTWWFRTLVVLAALGGVALAAWSASRRQYRRELARVEARRALEAERARISRDVHDEVGASLTEIAILSELARRELDRPEAASDRLERIAASSRAMLDSLGQIVWAINPKNDRLPALAAYLREHAARYLDTAGLGARLHFPAVVPDRPVSAEVRRNVFLILKEALHNMVRHAGAREATVRLAVEGDRLTLAVADDGAGFAVPSGDGAAPSGDAKPPPNRLYGGNGLGNMARRAAEIGARLTVDSAPGRGTTLQLDVPLSEQAAVGRPRSAAPAQHRPFV
jgi:signal transduction histidine kinase/ligand-binding sensor domain-containing protein